MYTGSLWHAAQVAAIVVRTTGPGGPAPWQLAQVTPAC
jgi:hypothetical protein